MSESVYWIWLQLLFGVGSRRAELFMSYFSGPGEIYEGLQKGGRVGGMLLEKEKAAYEDAMRRAEELERRTRNKGCDILTPEHPAYPSQLKAIYSKPAALYVKGDLSCLQDALSIAMVGTRRHTDYGKAVAETLAGGLATAGAVVVSGLADGIDRICHTAALDAGGKTVGVMGCGLDVAYPKGAAAVKRRMSEQGAVVTEYPLGTEPYPGNFPTRNRLISGMCQGTVVVEADRKSGSLLTAAHALEQGRDVFAVPGSIFSVREQGTHQLLREGAILVESVEDILREYPLYAPPAAPAQAPDPADMPPVGGEALPGKRPLPEEASGEAARLYEVLEGRPVAADELVGLTGMPIACVHTALTELELFDVIQGYPGRQFGLK